MNAERLLAHYEKISDAPDAIPRLRRLILDLAVRGTLVEQDSNDEPASKSLKQMAGEKTRLVSMKISKSRRRRRRRSAAHSFLPFDLPIGWSPVRIEQILIQLQTGPFGSSLRQSDYQLGGVPVVNPASIQDGRIVPVDKMAVGPTTLARLASFKLQTDDIVLARRGEMGRCAVVTERESGWLCGTGSLILRSFKCIYPRFLSIFIGSPFSRRYLSGTAVGTTMQNLNQTILLNLPFGLPPLAEQHRIVAKVDELMALCDRLKTARTDRETTRIRLTATSLALLAAPEPDSATSRNHADFVLKHLTPLTTRPDQLKALRQTILNLAIRGKLVEQDANDEPASVLLERIAMEKARLVKTGEIKKDKRHHPVTEEQDNFRIPKSWSWCRLGSLSKLVTSGSRDWAKYYSDEGAVFVRMGNLSKDHYRLRLDNIQRVKPPSESEGTRTRLEAGDLLISITGDVGMLGLIPENFGEAYINQHTAMVRPMGEMKGRYLPELFRSPFAQQQFSAPQRGIKNSFRLTDITGFLTPLPPLAEQHRIVAKVNDLMALCDQLEDSLTNGDYARRRLLETLLDDVLEPDADRQATA